MAIYCGRRASASGGQPVWKVDENGRLIERLSPKPSQELYLHSPDGFQWGYLGSGPAQLALAILLDVTQDPDTAQQFKQWFKEDYVSRWHDQWTISEQEVEDWLNRVKGGPVFFSRN